MTGMSEARPRCCGQVGRASKGTGDAFSTAVPAEIVQRQVAKVGMHPRSCHTVGGVPSGTPMSSVVVVAARAPRTVDGKTGNVVFGPAAMFELFGKRSSFAAPGGTNG